MSEQLHLPVDGETVLITQIEEGLALVAGVGENMPATAEVLLNGDPSTTAQASIVCWQRSGPSTDAPFGFVALVPIGRLRRGQFNSLVIRRPGRPLRYALQRHSVGLDRALQAIAAEAGPAFAPVVDGVIEALLGGKLSPQRLRMVAALVRLAAHNDGFIEVIGQVEEGELYLQGWAADLPSGRNRVIAIGETPILAELTSAAFSRDDLGDRGSGFAALLEAGGTLAPPELRRILFRGRDGWRSVDVYQQHVLVKPRDVPGHVRSILPRMTATGRTLEKLELVAHRFDGHDTVSKLDVPVRLGVDFALAVEGGGIIVSGWMLDPEQRVGTVKLRVGGHSAVISDTWSRQARPDVTEAFRADPMFAGLDASKTGHGFLAFALGMATPGGATPVYLELSMAEAHPAYYPLSLVKVSARQALQRLLPSLDPRSVTASNAIELQFGPMLKSLEGQPPEAAQTHDVGTFCEDAPLALVIGADDTIADIGVLIALLGLNPETRNLPIVLAGPVDNFDPVGGEICRLAAFYGLNMRLVLADGVEDTCDALQAGIAATRADTLVLLSAHILPNTSGWLSALERAYRRCGGKCLVSPTILYEDESIRWAGTWIDGEGEERRLVNRFAGFPVTLIKDAEVEEVTAGTVECCILPRAAFEDVEGFARGYVGTAEKGLDLALRLKLAGTPAYWLPEVEMVGGDHVVAADPRWAELTHRLDRWAFDRRWSLVIANLRSPSNAVQ